MILIDGHIQSRPITRCELPRVKGGIDLSSVLVYVLVLGGWEDGELDVQREGNVVDGGERAEGMIIEERHVHIYLHVHVIVLVIHHHWVGGSTSDTPPLGAW